MRLVIIARSFNESKWSELFTICNLIENGEIENDFDFDTESFRYFLTDKEGIDVKPDDLKGIKLADLEFIPAAVSVLFIPAHKDIHYTELISILRFNDKFPEINFGIDLRGFPDRGKSDRFLFKVSKFFFLINNFNKLKLRNLFVLTRQFSKPKRLEQITKADSILVSRLFTPLLPITTDLFEFYFSKSFNVTTKDSRYIKNYLTKSVNQLNREIVDCIEKWSGKWKKKALKSNTQKALIENATNVLDVITTINEKPILVQFLAYSIICEYGLLSKSTRTYYTQAWTKRVIQDISELENLFRFIELFLSGVRELAENIVYHTSDRKGYFFFHLKPIDEVINSSELYFEDFKSYVDNIEESGDEFKIYENGFHRFLEFSIFDYEVNGIAKTIKKSQPKSDGLTFIDYFTPRPPKNISTKIEYPEFRHFAHLGLKTFTSIIQDRLGYFEIKSNRSKEQKDTWFIYKDTYPSKSRLVKSHMPGTEFQGLVPLISFDEPVTYKIDFEKESINEQIVKWLNEKRNKKGKSLYHQIKKFEDFTIHGDNPFKKFNREGIYDYIVDVSLRISKYIKNSNITSVSIDSKDVYDAIGTRDSFSTLFKILAYSQLEVKVKQLYIYNVSERELDQLIAVIRNISKLGIIWSNDSFLYLFDDSNSFTPIILTGSSKSRLLSANSQSTRLYGRKHRFFDKLYSIKETGEGVNSEGINDDSEFLSTTPFDIIIPVSNESNRPVTLFEHKTSNYLDRNIYLDYGFQINETHVRLGSKLHIRDFYDATTLFLNSFNINRFSYLIADQILNSALSEKKNFILVGYGKYSELTISNVESILTRVLSDGGAKLIGSTVIRDSESLQPSKPFNELLRENTAYHFVIVVPIASSLSTFTRIWKSILNNRNGRSEDSLFLDTTISLVVVRDDFGDDINSITRKEAFYGWKSIDVESRVISVNQGTQLEVQYGILKSTDWSVPIYCKTCFPEVSVSSAHQPLIETNKVSVVPNHILGLPVIENKTYQSFLEELDRIKYLKSYVQYGHIRVDHTHHLYYIDSKNFLRPKVNIDLVSGWLKDVHDNISEEIYDKNIVIINSQHPSNVNFVQLVNDVVFSGSAFIITIDFRDDFRDNVLSKFSYLSREGLDEICFFYVDDVLATGNTLNMASSYLKSMLDNGQSVSELSNDEDSTNFKAPFTGVITLINRLSKFRKADALRDSLRTGASKNFFSFIDLYFPPIKYPDTPCFLCKDTDSISGISEQTSFDPIRMVWINKQRRNRARSLKDLGYCKPRHFRRLEYTHSLYFLLNTPYSEKNGIGLLSDTQSVPVSIKRTELTKFFKYGTSYFNKYKALNTLEKIDMVKTISSPPLIYYHILRKETCDILSKEFLKIIDPSRKNEDLSVLDINLIIVLINQLVELRSTLVIRHEVIKNLWILFESILLKYGIDDNLIRFFRDLNNPKYSSFKSIITTVYNKSEVDIAKKWDDSKAAIKNNHKLILSNGESKFDDTDASPFSVNLFTKFMSDLDSIAEFNLEDKMGVLRNIGLFPYLYASQIKKVIFNDEMKSYWLSFLIGVGFEISEDVNNSIKLPEYKVRYKNDFYGFGSTSNKSKFNIFLRKNVRDYYFKWCILVNLDNNTLMRKSFQNLDNSYEIRSLLKTNFDDLENLQILSSQFYRDFKKLVHQSLTTDPHNQYILSFLKSQYECDTQSGDIAIHHYSITYIVSKYLEFLLDKRLRRTDKGKPLQYFDQIVGLCAEIMGCSNAFLSLKRIGLDDPGLNSYVVGKKGDLPPNMFEVDDQYHTYHCIKHEDDTYIFFHPINEDGKKDLAKGKIERDQPYEDTVIVRFLNYRHGHSDHDSAKYIGAITFLYGEGDHGKYFSHLPKDEKLPGEMFNAEFKERLKYFFFLKDSLVELLRKNFENDQFNSTVEQRIESIRHIHIIQRARHNAEIPLVNIANSFDLKNEILLNPKESYINLQLAASNVHFGNLYSAIKSGLEPKKIKQDIQDQILYNPDLEEQFSAFKLKEELEQIVEAFNSFKMMKSSGSFELTFDLKHDIVFGFSIKTFRAILFELITNVYKHADSNGKFVSRLHIATSIAKGGDGIMRVVIENDNIGTRANSKSTQVGSTVLKYLFSNAIKGEYKPFPSKESGYKVELTFIEEL